MFIVKLRRRCTLTQRTCASSESFDDQHASGDLFFFPRWVGLLERRCRTATLQIIYSGASHIFNTLRILPLRTQLQL